jgi:predicted metal-dependent hydrolase
MFTSHPLKLDWTQELPQHWNDHSPFKTHFLNALSVTFPDGEKFFIDSIKPYKDRITDPQQLAEIQEFIKQENWHRHLHIQYNDWMEKQGLPSRRVEDDMNTFWARIRPKWGNRACLAATICIEHITATNADLFLSYRTSLKRMHPHFEHVWRWHGIEEIEHKAVAIDVWNAIGGKTSTRRLAMCWVLAYYTYYMIKHTVMFLHADRQLWKWRTVKDAWVMLFDKQSGVIRCSAKHMWDFMRADWHPNQTDHSILLKYSKE